MMIAQSPPYKNYKMIYKHLDVVIIRTRFYMLDKDRRFPVYWPNGNPSHMEVTYTL